MITNGTFWRTNSWAMIRPIRPKPQMMKWFVSSSSMRSRRRRTHRLSRSPSTSRAITNEKL